MAKAALCWTFAVKTWRRQDYYRRNIFRICNCFREIKPGIVTVSGASVPDCEIDQQGAILAARDGSEVYILAASSSDVLGKLATKALPDLKQCVLFS